MVNIVPMNGANVLSDDFRQLESCADAVGKRAFHRNRVVVGNPVKYDAWLELDDSGQRKRAGSIFVALMGKARWSRRRSAIQRGGRWRCLIGLLDFPRQLLIAGGFLEFA